MFFLNKNKNKNKYNRYEFEKNYKIFLKLKKKKKIYLGVTVGRSGLKWLLEILKSHKGITGGGKEMLTLNLFSI